MGFGHDLVEQVGAVLAGRPRALEALHDWLAERVTLLNEQDEDTRLLFESAWSAVVDVVDGDLSRDGASDRLRAALHRSLGVRSEPLTVGPGARVVPTVTAPVRSAADQVLV